LQACEAVRKNSDGDSKRGRFLNRISRFKNRDFEEFICEIFLVALGYGDKRRVGVGVAEDKRDYGFHPNSQGMLRFPPK